MDNLHFACAESQLKTRDTWLTGRHKHCEYNLLRGIEQKLYGHLVYLQDVMPEPGFEEDENRVLNLCITAFRPGFHQDSAPLAARMKEAAVETWLPDLQTAIDITGEQQWQPLLGALAERDDLDTVTRWWLNNRLHGYPQTAGADASSLAWSNAATGQIPCLVRHGKVEPATLQAWLPEARDCVQEPDRQDDLHWLALGLLAAGQPQPAQELITLWTTANPASRQAWSVAAASGSADFTQPLQQAVVDDHIPDFWLVVHGVAAHLEFCIDRLARPESNPKAERAWFGLTGRRLPRVAAMALGSKKKGPALADVHTARQWWEQNRPTGRLCLGERTAESGDEHAGGQPFRAPLGLYFGADTEPVGPALWLDTQGRIFPSPTECHWQRARRMEALA